jgi:hypothetical protein
MTSTLYEITVRGPVGATIVAALEGFEVVAADEAETTFRGRVIDQSGLHGVLNRISGFGLELVRVAPVGASGADENGGREVEDAGSG